MRQEENRERRRRRECACLPHGRAAPGTIGADVPLVAAGQAEGESILLAFFEHRTGLGQKRAPLAHNPHGFGPSFLRTLLVAGGLQGGSRDPHAAFSGRSRECCGRSARCRAASRPGGNTPAVNGGIKMYRFWRFIFVLSIPSIYESQPPFPFALVSFTLSFKRKESPLRLRTWQ